MPHPFFIPFISYGKGDALHLGSEREQLFDWLGMRRREEEKGNWNLSEHRVKVKAT